MQKQFFGKYLVIVSLSFFLALILAFISANGNFPLGEDLAGGTQLTYKLDDSEALDRIRQLQRQLAEAAPLEMEVLGRQLETAQGALNQSRGNVADIIQRRADPTGTKNVRVEMIDNNTRMRVSMPSASPVLVQEIQRRIMTQGRLSIHHVINRENSVGDQGGPLYTELYKIVTEKVKQEFGASVTPAQAFKQPKALTGVPTLQEKQVHNALVLDWETRWLAVMRDVNHEMFDAKGEFQFFVDYRMPSQYGESAGEEDSTTSWQNAMLIVERDAQVRGSDIQTASSTTLGEKGPEVNITFTTSGARIFGDLTTRLCSAPYKAGMERMAIVLDGWIRSAPTIQEPILGGGCRISGAMDASEAARVAGVLNAGSLAFQLVKESETTTGPTLGHESIQQGMTAVGVGAILVVAFMLFYYRRAGTIACMALFFNMVLLLGMMCFIKATLTLPGIAGILLTIGMAVDANVLIYERIREEMTKGRTVRAAVDQGFDRAFVTIIDANLTTLIIGIVLYYVGSGPVKGFAMTLSLGILTSLFAGVFVTRTLMETYILRNTPGGGKGAMATYLVFNLLAALYFLGSANSEVMADFGGYSFAADQLFAGAIFLVAVASYVYVSRSQDEGKSQRFMTVALVTTGLLCSLAFFLYMGPEKQTAFDPNQTMRTVLPLSFYEPTGELELLRLTLMILTPLAFAAVAVVSQIYSRGDWTGLTMADWFTVKRDFDIMKWRHKAISVSLILNVAGVLMFILVQGRIYDTDFTGGTELIVNTRTQMPVDAVREKLKDLQKIILSKVEAQEAEFKAVIADIPAGLDEEIDLTPYLTTGAGADPAYAHLPKLHLPIKLDEASLRKFNTPRKLMAQLVKMEDELPNIRNEEFKAVAYGTSGQSFQINTGINSLLLQAVFDNSVHEQLGDVLQDESAVVKNDGVLFRFVRYNKKDHQEIGKDEQLLKDLQDAIREVSLRHSDQPAVAAAIKALQAPTAITATDGKTARVEYVTTLVAAHFPVLDAAGQTLADFPAIGTEIVEQFQQKTGPQLRAASNWRESLTVVDSSISTGTKVSALVALVLSMAAICLYVWIRFDFVFGYGLGAILSLLHDVAVTLLVFSLASMVMDVKLNMDVVAAILTLVGYSINDTIVVFDRVREERRAHRTRDILRVMNDSINRTLSRTILTSGTTLLAVLSLLALGGQSLLGLSIVLAIGILTGTYSSIYIACPFVYWWISRKGGKDELEHGSLVVTTGAATR